MISVEEFLQQKKGISQKSNPEDTSHAVSNSPVKVGMVKGANMPTSTGATKKRHPRIESRLRTELVCMLLDISKDAAKKRFAKLGGNTTENCAEIIKSSAYWITSPLVN